MDKDILTYIFCMNMTQTKTYEDINYIVRKTKYLPL